MNRPLFLMAIIAAANLAVAQVGSTASEGAKATGQKAQQYGDQAKARFITTRQDGRQS